MTTTLRPDAGYTGWKSTELKSYAEFTRVLREIAAGTKGKHLFIRLPSSGTSLPSKIKDTAASSESNAGNERASTAGRRLEDLQQIVKDAVGVAETLPEQYRLKCFELLLTDLLSGRSFASSRPQASQRVESQQKPIRLEVKALLRQYSVPEDIILEKFFVEGEIVPTYTIKKEKDTPRSRTQIMYALLIALENALKTGVFAFSMEEVKERCRSGQIYDAANFKNNFNNSKGLFTNLSNEDHIELSSDGKAELAEILLELKK